MKRINVLLVGFLLSYVAFFVYPVFFTNAGMTYFKYVPSYTDKIGIDLAQAVSFGKSFLLGESPYGTTNVYPPMQSILFSPIAFTDLRISFAILSGLTFLAIISLFVLAQKIIGTSPEMILIFLTGIISYGFQFELERGQIYTIVTAFLMWSLYLTYFTKHKYTAWTLFTLAVQLKLFPLFFIGIISKKNWKDALIILGINFSLLFVLGYNEFLNFLRAVQINISSWTSHVNHSLRSYLYFIDRGDLYPIALILVVAGWLYANYKSKGFDSLTILYCSCTALLIPAISHDYTLPILILPMALIFYKITSTIWLFVVSTIYSSMLFSYASKVIMVNNGLALLMLSGICLWLIANESRVCKIFKNST